jgi:hypothetical protein
MTQEWTNLVEGWVTSGNWWRCCRTEVAAVVRRQSVLPTMIRICGRSMTVCEDMAEPSDAEDSLQEDQNHCIQTNIMFHKQYLDCISISLREQIWLLLT